MPAVSDESGDNLLERKRARAESSNSKAVHIVGRQVAELADRTCVHNRTFVECGHVKLWMRATSVSKVRALSKS